MNCYLCGSNAFKKRPGQVRGLISLKKGVTNFDDDVSVLECSECGLVILSSHDHINEEHYKNSGQHPDNAPDIDWWLKETKKDDERRFNFLKSKIKDKNVLDFGCGIGGFVERAQKIATSANGIELETAIRDSFKDRNLSVFPNLKNAIDSNLKWDLITAFHVLEHLPDPLSVLNNLSSLLSTDGEIIIEVPNSEDALLSLYDSRSFQDFVYWCEHIFVFSESTLSALMTKANLKINWIKYIQRYPLSNHLYWLAHNKPQGHEIWSFLDDTDLNNRYESQLAKKGLTDTIILSVGASK